VPDAIKSRKFSCRSIRKMRSPGAYFSAGGGESRKAAAKA